MNHRPVGIKLITHTNAKKLYIVYVKAIFFSDNPTHTWSTKDMQNNVTPWEAGEAQS